MAKYKKFVSLIVLMFSLILFAGCASVDYSRFVYPNGQVTDRIVVEVDSKALESSCTIPKAELYKLIKEDLENSYLIPIRAFRDNYAPVGIDWTVPEQAMQGYKMIDEVRNGIATNCEIIGDAVICDVTFANTNIFNLYYNSISDGSNNTESDSETEEQLEFREQPFFNSYVQSSENAFAVLKTDYLQSFIEKYKWYFDDAFDLSDLKLTQEYASPNTNIYSNAAETATKDGIKMHHWEISADNLDFELEFYTVTPNVTSWYLLGLGITFVVTFLVWGYVRRKKQDGEENN